MRSRVSYRFQIDGIREDGRNDAKTQRVDVNFFENGEKKSCVFKRKRIREDRALMRSGRLKIMQTSEWTCERTCHKDKENTLLKRTIISISQLQTPVKGVMTFLKQTSILKPKLVS